MRSATRRGSVKRAFFGSDDATPTAVNFEAERNSVELWATSPERADYLKRRKHVRVWLIPAFVWYWLAAWTLVPDDDPGLISADPIRRWWGIVFLVNAVVTFVIVWVPYFAARAAFRERARGMATYRVRTTLNELSGEEGDIPLAKLFKLNRQQLDEYQQLTKQQQRLAFRMTQVTSIVGFLVLTTGVLISLQKGVGTATYVVARLTGLGALVSAYLCRTFFVAHQRADRQLNLYYREPHMMGRVLIAERLIGTSGTPAQRDALVDQLLRWPLPESGEHEVHESESKSAHLANSTPDA